MREAEQKYLKSEEEINTESAFEKVLLKSPNSSFLWIKYIALMMEQEGIERARQLSERALRVINYKNT